MADPGQDGADIAVVPAAENIGRPPPVLISLASSASS
jgi:hypothetical protein